MESPFLKDVTAPMGKIVSQIRSGNFDIDAAIQAAKVVSPLLVSLLTVLNSLCLSIRSRSTQSSSRTLLSSWSRKERKLCLSSSLCEATTQSAMC
jgi:hypothetical protein